MKIKKTSIVLMLALCVAQAVGQNPDKTTKSTETVTPGKKFSVSTPWLSFANFGEEATNTHHYELHVRYKLTPKDRIGIKLSTWKMFAPMGMPMKEQLTFDEDNFYPGRLREQGIGVTYQRFLWKGLFATAELMPLFKTYYDESEKKIGNGFKLYTTLHLGYQIPLFKNRMFIEPQVHCNFWPVDTGTPQSFKEMDNKWNKYFLFEPNLYLGINL